MKEKPAKQLSENVRREIEVRAYLIWESEGRPHGREREHWLRAEAEVLGRPPAKKAPAAKANGAAKSVVAAKSKRTTKSASKPAHRQS
ncbi:MAG TPA: DUF2934 domain-containing protein [Rhizomicrobium sp.]|nr:DUF2934 domain-containing protein [Rhizomicrobium sp.]